MNQRRGEQWGWTGGMLGSILWIIILSIVWIVQGRLYSGIAAICLFCLAVICTFTLAPWKHPSTRYWKLLLPLFLILFGAAALFILSAGGMKAAGMSWWFLFLILPCGGPMITMGARRWKDGDAKNVSSPTDGRSLDR